MSKQADQRTVTVLDADGERQELSAALTRLFEMAAARQRDYKLIAALLDTITEFVMETQGDVFVAPTAVGADGIPVPESSETNASKLALRPVLKARIESVLDSWSDDEAAWHLDIGVRQVRRRAQRGKLHFFQVGGRRRYPRWQFDSHREVLPGLDVVLAKIPDGWRHERIRTFMCELSSRLRLHGEPLSPADWLLLGNTPSTIVALVIEGHSG